MRLALFNDHRLGLVTEKIIDVTGILGDLGIKRDMVEVIKSFDSLSNRFDKYSQIAPHLDINNVDILAPISRPEKFICVLGNYAKHAEELGRKLPPKPEMFLKASSSIIGPSQNIVLPDIPATTFHYEAELAAVIGKEAKNVSEKEAMDYVFGYTTCIDASARGLDDLEVTALFRSKSFDTFGPIGPWIVTKDELQDPHSLGIRLWVNDELKQSGTTKDMVYQIPRLIEYASSVMTLQPGDVIATGTPPGVGPITSGDVVKIEIDSIGSMSIKVTGVK